MCADEARDPLRGWKVSIISCGSEFSDRPFKVRSCVLFVASQSAGNKEKKEGVDVIGGSIKLGRYGDLCCVLDRYGVLDAIVGAIGNYPASDKIDLR